MIKKILDLIRYKNLLFIIVLQALLYVAVINSVFHKYGIIELLNVFHPILLILSTTLIAAGGYVINAYFDVKTDEINHPNNVIVGNAISRKATMLLYQSLTACGIICGIALAFLLKNLSLGFIFLIIPGLLWFYSAGYKRQFLLGNIIISLCTFMVPFLVGFTADIVILNHYGDLKAYGDFFAGLIGKMSGEVYTWTFAFAIFAFALTLVREIIKDIEDIEGDTEIECRTVPIVWGISKTKILLTFLILIIIIGIIWAVIHIPFFETDTISLKYALLLIVIPLFVLIYLLIRAKYKKDFEQASALIKYIMLAGMLYTFIISFLYAKNYGIAMFNLFLVS